MEMNIVDVLARAASALDAASEEMTANPGRHSELSAMTALWLMEEADKLRSILRSQEVRV